jgi:hypothetical protein
MDTVVELAFEVLRLIVRLLAATLHMLFGILRPVAGPIAELLLEIVFEPVAEWCARGWRRIRRWVGHVTGLPRFEIPIAILLVMASIAGGFVAIVKVGQAVF